MGNYANTFSKFYDIFKLDRAQTVQHGDNHIQSNSIFILSEFLGMMVESGGGGVVACFW